MDLTLTSQPKEAELKRAYRRIFHYILAPSYVALTSICLMLIFYGINLDNPLMKQISLTFAGVYLILILTAFPRSWRQYRAIFQKKGIFDQPNTIHFADTFFESSCGNNYAKQEYRLFTHYVPTKHHIALAFKKSICAVVDRKDFPDGGEEWMRCLELCGVEPLRFWEIRRWSLPLLIPLFLLLAIGFHFVSARHNEEWCVGKGDKTRCINNLKVIEFYLTCYAEENPDNLLPQDLNVLKEFPTCADSEFLQCPYLRMSYVYIPYSKFPSPETAEHAPLIIDHLNGHYRWPNILSRSSRVRQTPILFADGHISLEEDLTFYMDIYDRYGGFLSPEDAAVLKEQCEMWDMEIEPALSL